MIKGLDRSYDFDEAAFEGSDVSEMVLDVCFSKRLALKLERAYCCKLAHQMSLPVCFPLVQQLVVTVRENGPRLQLAAGIVDSIHLWRLELHVYSKSGDKPSWACAIPTNTLQQFE